MLAYGRISAIATHIFTFSLRMFYLSTYVIFKIPLALVGSVRVVNSLAIHSLIHSTNFRLQLIIS